MPLPRPASPGALWADVKAFWRNRSPRQWLPALLALLIPLAIVVIFFVDAGINTQPARITTSVEIWRADRTDEQIKADQTRRQAETDRRASERREEFRKIDEAMNRLGI